MGFGILLIGYFVTFAFTLSEYYFFADIIGICIMLYAFIKLDQYNRYFSLAAICGTAYLILCSVNAVSLMWELYSPTGTIDMIVDIGKQISACGMHIFIFLGTRGIAGNAESDKLVKNTDRNFVMTMVYYVFSVLVLVISPFIDSVVQYISAGVFFYWIVCIVLNIALLYKCFGIICPADEDENEIKRSRFAIVNKINDKFEEIEQNKQKTREESIRLAREEAAKRAEKLKSKKKKHVHNHKKKK
ncbi:MAG: hypothetical protein E7672_04180 [Ruminococcaceae bacterium]|nr:hypothetical protein [Oscillospiraceae bacterium]